MCIHIFNVFVYVFKIQYIFCFARNLIRNRYQVVIKLRLFVLYLYSLQENLYKFRFHQDET